MAGRIDADGAVGQGREKLWPPGQKGYGRLSPGATITERFREEIFDERPHHFDARRSRHSAERLRDRRQGSQARRDYHKSVVTYQNCLAAHASDTGACEADRLSMLAAQREYDDFVAALTPGMMGTVNVATQHQ